MRAVLHRRFGPPDELTIEEVTTPVPGDTDLLIRIHATTVTSSDCNVRNLSFAPQWAKIPMRLFAFGVFRPRKQILGIEFAGVVEKVGRQVQAFKEGDEVFGTPGDALGSHAEFLRMPEHGVIVRKPQSITMNDAATLALAGNTALYFLRDLGEISSGQKICINGASGAIGSFAIQLAKHFGAHVTAVCGPSNGELVKTLGADTVIDYTREDFTRSETRYDLVFDAVGKSSFLDCKTILTRSGVYMTTLPTAATLLRMLTGNRRIRTGDASPSRDNLAFLSDLADRGIIRPVIDCTYSLDQIALAYRYVEQGHKKGNVILTIGDETTQVP